MSQKFSYGQVLRKQRVIKNKKVARFQMIYHGSVSVRFLWTLNVMELLIIRVTSFMCCMYITACTKLGKIDYVFKYLRNYKIYEKSLEKSLLVLLLFKIFYLV